MTQFQTIAAPPLTPPRYSLLTCATVIDDAERWQQGVQWAPESDHWGQAVELGCDGSAAVIGEGTILSNPDVDSAYPFVVSASDRCSTFGFKARDYEGRARRLLEADQSRQIAYEFWHQTIGAGNASVGLNDITMVITGTACSVVTAFGLMEGWAAERIKNRRAMIHCSPQVLSAAHAAYLLEQVGPLWVTPMGTVVVADAGYDGGATTHISPGATEQVAFVTPWVSVRLSPVEINPGTGEEALRLATDRSTNTVTYTAQREALIQWDKVATTPAGIVIDIPRWEYWD
jgi:hypothetical protein